MKNLEGRTAVITGSASGIGLALAESFARAGMNIVMADVEEGALKTAATRIESLGTKIMPVVTNVADEAAMDQLSAVTRQEFGPPDIVCLNAGVSGTPSSMEHVSLADWKWAIDVNLYGVIHGIRVFLPDLVGQDAGSIIVTASVAGLLAAPFMGPYAASKHAVVGIAKALHSELVNADSKVTAHCLCPGMVLTNIDASDRNRPSELRSEHENVSIPEEIMELFAHGEDIAKVSKTPEDVAEMVLNSVSEGRFWIETDEYHRQPLKDLHRSIESQTAPTVTKSIMHAYLPV